MRVLLLALVPLLGCAPKPAANQDIEALATRTAQLEQRVAELEDVLDRVTMVVDIPSTPEREAAAYALATQIREAMETFDMARASELLDRAVTEYGDTTVGRSAVELAEKLSRIGQEANLDGATWIRGEHVLDPKRTTMLVFFEAWCPHCQREVPVVQKQWEILKDDGLDVVGVTSLSRGTTTEQMDAFLKEAGVGFPVARDDGRLWVQYGAEGVPHAVIVKDGKIAWLGHPGTLQEDGALQRFLK